MTKSVWMLHAKKADFNGLAARFHISPITARIIRNRDITDIKEFDKYLNGSLKDLYDPRLLPDMEKAVSILKEKIGSGARIRIVGDYDIDGVCSTCILYKGLSRVGAKVDYVIPERIKDGYGINEHIIEKAAADGIHMILTCDNGIAAIDQIAEAKKLGMTVVVQITMISGQMRFQERRSCLLRMPLSILREKTVNIRLVRSAALWWHID